jgi:hydrogenase maturation protein HypF
MAPFAMCSDCRREYDDPRDRRFHAQPVACPACGPRLVALDDRGEPVNAEDPLGWAVGLLREKKIGALKGIGGWHLACDARDQAAVAALRRRKHREEKPFALMVRDLAAAESLCEVSAGESALLTSPARPVVLLRRRAGARVAEAVAPDNPLLGVMLPYTPLQHLLLRESGQPLVMTSANRSDEPIAYQDRDAVQRLSGIADFFLGSDREIHLRCDDSVLRVVGEVPVHFRRSRGFAPSPLRLEPPLAVPTLAVGGELKSTFALGDGGTAFLSHHLGDLEHAEAFRAFAHAALHYRRLYRIEPRRLVHDLHPDYASTRYAQEQAAREGLSLVAVQHHHAHLAACLAENGEQDEAIGVCFDGSGYGGDGTLWGGEFLVGSAARAIRAAHLLPVPLPGGEQAVREPWRMALAHLRAAGKPLGDLEVARRVPPKALRAVERMLERGFNSPLTSSMGRLFDAAAAIAYASTRVSYEGQAAIRLEALAASTAADGSYPFELCGCAPLRIDPRPAVLAAAADARRGAGAAAIARRFHSGVVEMVAQVCARLRAGTGLRIAALTGGVFLNAILTAEVEARLAGDGFRVLRHRLVPPNDGGLSLGQLAVVAARDARDRKE